MFGAWGNGVLGVEGGQKFQLWWWILLVLVPLASLGLHELVHAFFFSQFAPPGSRVTFGSNWEMGMIYASAEGIMYTRDQYLVIALAPSIVVSLLLMVLGMGLRWPLWTVIVVTVHLTGCSGDWGYVRAIRNDPAIAYCRIPRTASRSMGSITLSRALPCTRARRAAPEQEEWPGQTKLPGWPELPERMG